MYTIHVIVANLVRLSDTNKSNNELNTQYFSSAKGGGGGGVHKEFRVDIVCDLTHKGTRKLED